MKAKRIKKIVGILSLCLLFSACSGESTASLLDSPIADPAGQKYNTLNKSLPLTLIDPDGSTIEVAVQANVVADETVTKEGEEYFPFERYENHLFPPVFDPSLDMQWYKCSIIIVPLEKASLSGENLSFFCGRWGDKEGDRVLSMTTQVYSPNPDRWGDGHFYLYPEENGPAFFSDIWEHKGNEGNQYYEITTYAYLPSGKDSKRDYVFGILNHIEANPLSTGMPEQNELPHENVLCWEIPDVTVLTKEN